MHIAVMNKEGCEFESEQGAEYKGLVGREKRGEIV